MEDYVIPTMQAGADYEGYLLGTSFARPILAKRVVEIAGGDYKQSDATGFISIYGLPTKVQAIVRNEKEGL